MWPEQAVRSGNRHSSEGCQGSCSAWCGVGEAGVTEVKSPSAVFEAG